MTGKITTMQEKNNNMTIAEPRRMYQAIADIKRITRRGEVPRSLTFVQCLPECMLQDAAIQPI